MSRSQDPHPSRSIFPFGNPFRMKSHKGSHLSPQLLGVLQGFETTLAERLRKLMPKSKDEILSLSWMTFAIKSLCESHNDIRTLITDLDLPVSVWDAKWVDVYFDISTKLLDICNAFSSELSRLNQGNLPLKCALHHLGPTSSKSFLRACSLLDDWRRHINAKNPRIEQKPPISISISISIIHFHNHFLTPSQHNNLVSFSLSKPQTKNKTKTQESFKIPDHNNNNHSHCSSYSDFSRLIHYSLKTHLKNSMFSTPFILTFSLLLSLPIIFFLAPRILPPHPNPIPISPSDELDDINLFNTAISHSSSSSPPNSISHPSKFFHLSSKNPNLKIAFLFLTNTDLHFTPLWNLFFQTTPKKLYNIYVHSDPRANITRVNNPLFKFISSKNTYRASPTLISATRRLLATAILDDPSNAYFIVLSQYCIPLHSFNYIYRSLFLSPTFDLTDTESTKFGVRLKYKSFVEIISNGPKLWKRYIARGRYAMMPEVPFEKFRVGSQFFTLTRKHALVVVKDRTLWRKFKVPCYYDDECYPEEHYFSTLLSMNDPDGVTSYTLTNVNWTGTVNGHPHTYRPEEVSSELILRLRKSNHSESYLFARKFVPDCLEPLMNLAKSVIFKD